METFAKNNVNCVWKHVYLLENLSIIIYLKSKYASRIVNNDLDESFL